MGRLSTLLSMLMLAAGLGAMHLVMGEPPITPPSIRTLAPFARIEPTPVVEYPSKPEVVVIEQNALEPGARMGTAPPPRATPRPGDRVAIARELQGELRRVGCYDGEPNGAWTPATRRAMKAFTDRINAALPIDEPDLILLALVRVHQDKACGASCPTGQTLATDGRCMPTAILERKLPHAARTSAPRANSAIPAITVRSGEAVTPLVVGTGSTAPDGPQAQTDRASAAEQPSTLAPGLTGPSAPAPAAAQGAHRPADPAQRSAPRQAGFGPGTIWQFGKYGF